MDSKHNCPIQILLDHLLNSIRIILHEIKIPSLSGEGKQIDYNMNERKIIFLVNPVSGTAKKTKIIQHIRETFTAKQIPFEILPTHETGDYREIEDKVESENVTDIVIVGGDGSVNHVVAALHKYPVNFGIVPFGSGNGLARSAGISMNPKEAVATILDGMPSNIDAFSVSGKFACMLTGLGLDAQVAHDFAKKNTRGLMTYVTQSIADFFKSHPYPFEIKVNGRTFFTEAYFISIANANQFGNNFTIAPKAHLNDGLLDIVIVQKMKKARLPFAVLKQLRGNNKLKEEITQINSENILYFQAETLEISNPNHAPLHIDGEPMESIAHYKIHILKDCFKLLIGKI